MSLSAATLQARAALAAPAIGAGPASSNFLGSIGGGFAAMFESVYRAVAGEEEAAPPVPAPVANPAPSPVVKAAAAAPTSAPTPIAVTAPPAAVNAAASPAPAVAGGMARSFAIDTSPQGLSALHANSVRHSGAVGLTLPPGAAPGATASPAATPAQAPTAGPAPVPVPAAPGTSVATDPPVIPSPAEFADRMRAGLDKYNALMAERTKPQGNAVDTQQ